MTSNILEPKKSNEVRFFTFNVNGIRTLFQHYPFSRQNGSLSQIFQSFKSDIVTLQELKIDRDAVAKWGRLDNYYSFISIPSKRRGYSGVGCWVRIPDASDPNKNSLKVIKAEEGITGVLKIRVDGRLVSYRSDSSVGIGGYEELPFQDDTEAEELDSQGRCVIIELACNIVIISTYCPANSSNSDEGELFRLKYLRILFKRIRNLKNAGKSVVLMGDINICRDLIDHGKALKYNGIVIRDLNCGNVIEDKYRRQAFEFIAHPTMQGRRMLNEMLADSIDPVLRRTGILVDTTRLIQGRNRLKMYTVWSTLRNSRPVNYGSRIDYILVTEELQDRVKKGNICPDVMGSDHCPVFMDLSVEGLHNVEEHQYFIPKFESRFRYNLAHESITDMFKKRRIEVNGTSAHIENLGNENINAKTYKTLKVTQGDTPTISKFLQQSSSSQLPRKDTISVIEESRMIDNNSKYQRKHDDAKKRSPVKSMNCIEAYFGKPPVCKHGEDAVLRTSKTSTTFGKRFWTCKRPRGDKGNEEASCGFFQWK
ncbi:HFR014Wp [Eremothecium sinecaudum]|uniref:DNA-(apurinic or apyrimidinic site) endonuclease 2 n=1 Tax=Eremothecium sinecaudum TaxID=45286 RepID=A0A0X8HUQ5_9SACH|nr:HFR014Wp [Eremothecium sinecaudum]AMD21869.1 HFR014Wp [Eremothecium sinecaudum]